MHDFGYVNTSALAAMFWGRYGSAVRERLKLLHDIRLLDKLRPRVGRTMGAPEWVYRLTLLGWRVLRDVAALLDASPQTISRWQTGKGEPAGRLSARLGVLEAVVDELAAFHPPHRVHDWIFTPHRLLGHAKPAERIQAGRGDEVLAVIAQLRDGAFG